MTSVYFQKFIASKCLKQRLNQLPSNAQELQSQIPERILKIPLFRMPKATEKSYYLELSKERR